MHIKFLLKKNKTVNYLIMKKLILLIVFLLLLTLTYSFNPIFNNVFNLHNVVFSNPEYSIYCLDYANLENTKNVKIIDNGNSYIIKSSVSLAKNIKQNSYNVLGESVKFETNRLAIDKIIRLLDIEIKFKEDIDGITTLYGYSNNNDFYRSVIVENELINIQIAYKNGILTIGSPLILGDY